MQTKKGKWMNVNIPFFVMNNSYFAAGPSCLCRLFRTWLFLAILMFMIRGKLYRFLHPPIL